MERVQSKVTRQFGIGILVGLFIAIMFMSGAVFERVWGVPILNQLTTTKSDKGGVISRVVSEENMVSEVVEKASSGVVTVSYKRTTPVLEQYYLDPWRMFRGMRPSGEMETEQVDIGSGFIVDNSGLVVTNKHVVDLGSASDYTVILADDSEYTVEKIWRDPVNDLAILKISNGEFEAIELGDSDNPKVGNFVVAIGTALGEFRHTVTTGVISGLGRGILAGDGLRMVEKIDNVIQTDAAINPGNSGGPLLNSSGQVIGVNVAVSQGANNIGFALPINVVKESIKNFNETGQFERPVFGVRYQMITKEQGILNNVPAGAYVVEVVENSSAETAGVERGDIITKFDGRELSAIDGGLVELMRGKKIGDSVEVEIWRDGEIRKLTVGLKGE